MLLMLNATSPLLARVTVCAALEVPTARLVKARLAGVRATTAPDPSPSRLITWGDPAASSWMRIDPDRVPTAIGEKVTEKVQLPAADTLVPQVSDSAKSPLALIDEIVNGELPMLRRRAVCG
jgi:hypothetical protein